MPLHNRLFPKLNDLKWTQLNLDECVRNLYPHLLTVEPNPLIDPYKQDQFVRELHHGMETDCSWGGHLEDRSALWRGHYQEAEKKFIHLGVDYNVPFLSEVFCPKDGLVVEIFHDHDQNGGWGTRVIMKVAQSMYAIFAHLRRGTPIAVGQAVNAGTVIGHVAGSEENGGWFPHLHVQCLRYPMFNRPEKPFDSLDGYGKVDKDNDHWYPNPELML